MLILFGRKPFQLGSDDQALLDSFVAQAAVAIRNAALYATEAEARHAAELATRVVGNAIKFCPQGEVVVDVQLAPKTGAADQGNDVAVVLHVAVRDTGIGIPEAKQQLIFEPFTQSDGSTTCQYGGTGLGLAISKQLIELMGGHLWVQSVVGQGSTFHFTARFDAQGEGADPHTPVATVQLHGLSVLIVDDNASNRRHLHELLSHWGMRPTSVAAAR